MKDEIQMKSPVSAVEGSRFSAVPPIPEKTVPSVLTPAASRALPSRFAVSLPEESLVVDDRSHLTPAQAVENTLINRLRESSLPVSHLQMRGLVKNRYQA